ncbi:MAG: hypothetical protein WCR08_13425 [Gammaproteobacteria bacterium]
MSILFKEKIWVLPAGIGQGGEWDEETREHIHNLRGYNSEIETWGDLAIGLAFGSYSEDILGVSWAEWSRDRNSGFMCYIYIKQTCPTFYFHGYESEFWGYGDTYPWLSNEPMPKWVVNQIQSQKEMEYSKNANKFIEFIASFANNSTISDDQHEAFNQVLRLLPSHSTLKEKLKACLIDNSEQLGLKRELITALLPLQGFIEKALSASRFE